MKIISRMALACALLDLAVRLIFPINTLITTPTFFLAVVACVVAFVVFASESISQRSERRSNGVKAAIFILLVGFWMLGGAVEVQSFRRRLWFEGKKPLLEDAVKSYQDNGGPLASRFRSIGPVAGLDPSARTNESGNLEIIIGFPGQLPRGGIVYIAGEPPPPDSPLGRVLHRSLGGDNWYEFIIARNEGEHRLR